MASSAHACRITALACLIGLALAGDARGASVSVEDGAIRFTAAPGEENGLWGSASYDGTWTFKDRVSLFPGPGCETWDGPTSVRCPGSFPSLEMDLGDGDDRASLGGGASATRLRIVGGVGDDWISASTSVPVHVEGGPGVDYIWGGSADDVLEGGDDTDGIAGEGGGDRILGGAGNDRLVGNSGDRHASGPDGDDVLEGGPGSDWLVGEGGDDVISGGPAADRVEYTTHDVPVTVTLDGLPGDGAEGENDSIGPDVEAVMGGSEDDLLIGNADDNGGPVEGMPYSLGMPMSGGGGDDTIVGRGGADNLTGGDGDDLLYGFERSVGGSTAGDGSDRLEGGAGSDFLIGGRGNDYAAGDSGDDHIDAREPADALRAEWENVYCDAGIDFVELDYHDTHHGECERVERSGMAGDLSPPGYASPPTEPPARVEILSSKVRAKRGQIPVRVWCPAHASSCTGRARLHARGVTLAKSEFQVAPVEKVTIRVPLGNKARRLVRRDRRVKARLELSAAAVDPTAPMWRTTVLLRAGSF